MMGDPIKLRKKYNSPRKPWDKSRIVAENELIEKYGLSSKREVWVAKTMLRRKRISARNLFAAKPELLESGKKRLIESLTKQGILSSDATLDGVLALNVEDFLERRLQTLVYRRGLANTIKQARQFIVHGWIEVNGHKVKAPSALIAKEDEEKIRYYKGVKPKILDVRMDAPELQKSKLQKETAKEDTENGTEKDAEDAVENNENLEEVVE